MSQSETAERPPTRSTFVSVVAWVFLAFAVMGVFAGLLQNIMLAMVFPTSDSSGAPSTTHFRSVVGRPWHWFAVTLLVPAATVFASIGLLRRKDWARRLFMGILALGAVWLLSGLFSTPFDADGLSEDIVRFLRVTQILMAVLAIGLVSLFVWIIWRLSSASVRAEFHA